MVETLITAAEQLAVVADARLAEIVGIVPPAVDLRERRLVLRFYATHSVAVSSLASSSSRAETNFVMSRHP